MNEQQAEKAATAAPSKYAPKVLYKVLLEEYERLKLLSKDEATDLRRLARRKRQEKNLKTDAEIRREFPDASEREAESRRQLDLRGEFRFEMLEAIRAKMHGKKTDERPAALCLSGGGIRSATFNLGVLQALAQHKLLDKFDYLSTVSGGGYIGSWLSAWIYRKRIETEKFRADAEQSKIVSAEYVQKVQEELCDTTPDRVEPPEITYLRSYSNFMSPRPGAASTDTWTLVAVYLRNLLLNWTVAVPLIAAALMLPRFLAALIDRENYTGAIQFSIWAVSAVAGIVTVANIIAMRPTLERFSWVNQRYEVDDVGNVIGGESKVRRWCLLPLLVTAFGMTIYWAWVTNDRLAFSFNDDFLQRLGIIQPRAVQPAFFVLFGEILFLGGFAAAHLTLLYRKNQRKIRENAARAETRSERFEANLIKEFFISIVGGALGGALLFLFTDLFALGSERFSHLNATKLYVCFGAPLFLIAFLLSAAFFVGVAGQIYDDIDREWLSRFGAWILIVIVGWSVLSGVVLFAPEIFGYDWKNLSVPFVGSISGLITLILGFSRKSPATDEKPSESRVGSLMRIAPRIAAPVFALFLVALISYGTLVLLAQTSRLMSDNELVNLTLWFVVFIAVGCLMGWFININKFSLHAMYRERLIRAYLGASRAKDRLQTANSFTDLDGDDNIEMQKLRFQKPLHIVNMTLNLGSTNNLRWQNRKAESFTVSALHCGSSNMGSGSGLYRDSRRYGYNQISGEAITLGTAAAISGAAASPNMGYYSQSSAVSFLMALFNIRLGWWLGNPGLRGNNTFDRAAPRFAPRLFFSEAFGDTDDTNPYVYLSDGGHFDNLGLYEMVLRQCHFIVACDAGADAKFGFFDFGTAIHKIRVDMGIPIEFETGKSPKPGRNCAIATIKYSAVDGKDVEDGVLIYIKPTLDGDEPIDIVNYKSVNRDFPHETTADQMYSESQFESYRSLGFHMIDSICCVNKESTCTYISNFLKSAETYLESKVRKDDQTDGR
jgi:predicted acylesterase/phospholipase RssA